MSSLLSADSLLALLTLTSLEIVLGLDNIVFLTILVGRVEPALQDRARKLGISGALVMRLGLLFSITWVMGLTEPLFSLFGKELSGRDLILIAGGAFLIAKATWEIHEKLESGPDEEETTSAGNKAKRGRFVLVILQIMVIDIVFSLDSVITAVGMAQELAIMVIAMVLAVGVMFFSSAGIGRIVNRHPTIKMLALSFLILIGVTLLMEGFGAHVNKGYIYFAMGFSLVMETININFRKKGRRPVKLREPGV